MKRRNESGNKRRWVKRKVLDGMRRVAEACSYNDGDTIQSRIEDASIRDIYTTRTSADDINFTPIRDPTYHNVPGSNLGRAENSDNSQVVTTHGPIQTVHSTRIFSEIKNEPTPELLLKGLEREHYEFRSVIDNGTYGKIYRAVLDEKFCKGLESYPQVVAIKVIAVADDNERQLVHNEIKIHKSVNGISEIVTLFGHFQYEQTENIVMEYLHGGNLAKLISDYGPFNEEQALSIMKDIFLGLIAMHDRNIAHLDIKTKNVGLKGPWHHDNPSPPKVCLIDFGLSMKCDEELTQPVGTPGCVAPEMLSRFVTHPSCSMDIFSGGIIFYELLCGSEPFICYSFEDQLGVMDANELSIEKMKTRPGVADETKQMVLSCLEKNPELRPTSKSMTNFLAYRLWKNEVEQRRKLGGYKVS